MPDLLQPGPLLSLPLLHSAGGALEADLREWTRSRPLTLVLPCHVRDQDGPALEEIVATLASVPWVSHIIVGLDGADVDAPDTDGESAPPWWCRMPAPRSNERKWSVPR